MTSLRHQKHSTGLPSYSELSIKQPSPKLLETMGNDIGMDFTTSRLGLADAFHPLDEFIPWKDRYEDIHEGSNSTVP